MNILILCDSYLINSYFYMKQQQKFALSPEIQSIILCHNRILILTLIKANNVEHFSRTSSSLNFKRIKKVSSDFLEEI